MDSTNPLPYSNILGEQFISEATILAFSMMSEGFLLGIDSCRDNGKDLSDIQKIEMLQCINYVFRNYEKTLREHVLMMLALSSNISDEDREQLTGMFNDILDEAHKINNDLQD